MISKKHYDLKYFSDFQNIFSDFVNILGMSLIGFRNYLIWNHAVRNLINFAETSNNKNRVVVEYLVAYCKQTSLIFCRLSPYTANLTSKGNKIFCVNTAR